MGQTTDRYCPGCGCESVCRREPGGWHCLTCSHYQDDKPNPDGCGCWVLLIVVFITGLLFLL